MKITAADKRNLAAAALREVLADAERLDFVEAHHGNVAFVEKGFYFSSNDKESTAHGGYSPTARGAIDLAIQEIQRRAAEAARRN